MTFFESLLALLLVAILLLQIASRIGLPYPAMLAVAGMAVAFVPGVATIRLDPGTALALFIAPVLLDAAFDFPLVTAGRLWRPLVILIVGAVIATTGVVAWIGWAVAGLPIAAAIVLGAIVAPPDAAAATAVIGSLSLPRTTVSVLKGESLLNDATALLLFSGALAFQMADGSPGEIGLHVAIAVPGGILLGFALSWPVRWIQHFAGKTLGANLLQFVTAWMIWLIADHLHLSAVLAVVAFAVTAARSPQAGSSPRMRVHSFAVWAAVVFLLNVTAFLVMGMQARSILERLPGDEIWPALRFAGLVVLAVIVTRLVVVMAWGQVARRSESARGTLPPPTIGQSVLVGWCGMRGLVTLATAFALPATFPQRDLVVLTAFAVVLATLVGQGLTLAPLIRWLGLDRMEDPADEMSAARTRLVTVALDELRNHPEAEDLALLFKAKRDKYEHPEALDWIKGQHGAGLAVVSAQRAELARLLDGDEVGIDSFYVLQEELDWRELTLLPEEERRIAET